MSNEDAIDLLRKWRRSDGMEGGYQRTEDILPQDFNDIIATIKAKAKA
jgi:hypothetical protein